MSSLTNGLFKDGLFNFQLFEGLSRYLIVTDMQFGTAKEIDRWIESRQDPQIELNMK
jgi:hypothetical protein